MASNEAHNGEGLVALETTAEGVKRLKAGEHFTDLVIACNGHEWNVHKLWLCAQSEFFKKACLGRYVEAQENRITLADDDPKTLAAFIHFLYHFNYDDHRDSHDEPLSLDVDIYIIGDKYLVDSLKELAVRNFEQRAKLIPSSDEFFNAITKIYQQTYDGEENALRNAPINVLKGCNRILVCSLLRPDGHFERFSNVLSQNEKFARDLLKMAVEIRRELVVMEHCKEEKRKKKRWLNKFVLVE